MYVALLSLPEQKTQKGHISKHESHQSPLTLGLNLTAKETAHESGTMEKRNLAQGITEPFLYQSQSGKKTMPKFRQYNTGVSNQCGFNTGFDTGYTFGGSSGNYIKVIADVELAIIYSWFKKPFLSFLPFIL